MGGWFNKAKAAALDAKSKVAAAAAPHMSKAKTFVDTHVANAKTGALAASEQAQRDAIRNRGNARNAAAGVGNMFQKVGIKRVPFIVSDGELKVFYDKLDATERAIKGVVAHSELFDLKAGAMLTSMATLTKVMQLGAARPAAAAHPGDDSPLGAAEVEPVFSEAALTLRDGAIAYAATLDNLIDGTAGCGSTRALWKDELFTRVLLPASQKIDLIVSQKAQIFEIEKKRRAVETLTEEVAFCSAAKSEAMIAQKDAVSEKLLLAQAEYVNERADLMLALQARFAEVADVVAPLLDELRYCQSLLLLSASSAIGESIQHGGAPSVPLLGEKTSAASAAIGGADFEAAPSGASTPDRGAASASLLGASSFLDDPILGDGADAPAGEVAPSAEDIAAADALLSGLGDDDGGI